MNLDVKTEAVDDIRVLKIRGEVDLYSSPQVRKAIMTLTQQKSPIILIDLARVSYMDSSGIATLVEGLQQASKYKGKFAVVNLRSAVREVFELSRLDKVFDIFENQDEALAKLG